MIGASTLRLLLLTGTEDQAGPLVELLRSQHQVVEARSLEEALQELRGGNIDAVISSSSDFLPLERALASRQSGLILDTIGGGVCITDVEGRILWSNRRIRQWSEVVR